MSSSGNRNTRLKPNEELLWKQLTRFASLTEPKWNAYEKENYTTVLKCYSNSVQRQAQFVKLIVARSRSSTFHVRASLIARFMGPTWGPSGADRTQVGPMLAPWTLLSGLLPLQCQADITESEFKYNNLRSENICKMATTSFQSQCVEQQILC